MLETAGRIASMILGLVLIVLRRSVARTIVRSNNAAWGFTWGERERRMGEITMIPVGIVFMVLGVLGVGGILPA